MINILLADDHAIIRAGIKIFIDNYLPDAVIEEASDGASAIEKIKENNFELIVLDINMPNTDAFSMVSNIIKLKPDANILMFSMNAEEMYAKKFLQLGAKGYVSKSAPKEEMETALDTVLKGKRYLSPLLLQSLADDVIGKKSKNPFDDLSKREFEITMHLIKGEPLAEIAKALKLHTSTVGTHKARIFDKLNCTNIIEVNTLAKIHGIYA